MVYQKVSSIFKQKFHQLVSKSNKILITTHIHPDGDAIGSVLGLYNFLIQKYPQKTIDIKITGNFIDRFQNIEDYQIIKFVDDIATSLKQYQLLICLDGGEYHRFSNTPEKLVDINAICIDHHPSPPDKFSIHLVDTMATSTAELVFKIVEENFLNEKICSAILLGILEDTGTFNYIKPGQYHVFDIVKKILEITNINIQEFKSTYSLISQDQFEIIAQFIQNSQFHHVKNWPDFQVSYITRDYIEQRNISDNLCSVSSDIFIGHYLRLIKGYSWGFVVKPYRDGSCSISLRSLPKSVNVRNLMEKMSLGGGHDRAAGGKFIPQPDTQIQPAEAIKQIISWMERNLPELS